MTKEVIPCVMCDGKLLSRMTVKEHFAKIDEELNELKSAVLDSIYDCLDLDTRISVNKSSKLPIVTDEAADTITAITSMLEAMGIHRDEREEAQQRVNERNMKRGRLGDGRLNK